MKGISCNFNSNRGLILYPELSFMHSYNLLTMQSQDLKLGNRNTKRPASFCMPAIKTYINYTKVIESSCNWDLRYNILISLLKLL